MRFVYMLRCQDETIYTGVTKDLEQRLIEHNTSKQWAKYTRARRPVKMIWSQEVVDRTCACKLEHKIKQLKKSQKEDIIKTVPQNLDQE